MRVSVLELGFCISGFRREIFCFLKSFPARLPKQSFFYLLFWRQIYLSCVLVFVDCRAPAPVRIPSLFYHFLLTLFLKFTIGPSRRLYFAVGL